MGERLLLPLKKKDLEYSHLDPGVNLTD
jgi:hypothetical protein